MTESMLINQMLDRLEFLRDAYAHGTHVQEIMFWVRINELEQLLGLPLTPSPGAERTH